MKPTPNAPRGFTVIELMVTVAVLLVIAAIAQPSVQAARQRAALRATSEQALGFWNQARLEAAKRNKLVKVGVVETNTGAQFCLGAAETTLGDSNIDVPCDCMTAGACDVATFPGDQTDLNSVTLSAVTLGGVAWPSGTIGTVVIEPKRTALLDSTTAGTVTLLGPPGNRAYQLRLSVDGVGRGVLCEPAAAVDKLSDYHGQHC
jgi:prepilin-type N-terminal cleavage/methylation domain-containing protein